MNKNREYYVEVEFIDGRVIVGKSTSRDIRNLSANGVFSVKYYVLSKGNDVVSRKSDTYYNGKRINEDFILSNGDVVEIKPYSLTFDEKIHSDEQENLFVQKFKKLASHIGQTVRVHYILNGVEDSVVGKLEYVDYYRQVILSNKDIPFSIPFMNANACITRINTDHENIFENEFLSKEISEKDQIILSYGKNYYNKKKTRNK